MDACNTLDEVEQALREIFAKLDSHFNTAPSDYTGTTGKVINLIAKRYMEPDLSVEMICDCLGKSRSYLSRMFKENTGMNLLDYLHTTRLGEAKKLLNETDLGISEIAAKVGYYSGWTLARVFKRYEGITPTAYRKAFCNTAEG
jgi:AraC-like DNA-binding protein